VWKSHGSHKPHGLQPAQIESLHGKIGQSPIQSGHTHRPQSVHIKKVGASRPSLAHLLMELASSAAAMPSAVSFSFTAVWVAPLKAQQGAPQMAQLSMQVLQRRFFWKKVHPWLGWAGRWSLGAYHTISVPVSCRSFLI